MADGDDGVRRAAVVRPPTMDDTNRARVAQLALTERHEDLVRDAGDRVGVPGYAFSYAVAVVERDDEHGRQLGWVTRGDLVRWADVVTAARAAAEQLDPAHDGRDPVGCLACDLRRAVGRLREAAAVARRAGVEFNQIGAHTE